MFQIKNSFDRVVTQCISIKKIFFEKNGHQLKWPFFKNVKGNSPFNGPSESLTICSCQLCKNFNYFQALKGNKTKVSEKNNYFVMKIPIKSQEPQKGP